MGEAFSPLDVARSELEAVAADDRSAGEGRALGLFDEVVAFVGRHSSVEALASELGIESRDKVRVGAVLSVPVVLANLAEWVCRPAGAGWLEARLASFEAGGPDGYASLGPIRDRREAGARVLATVLGRSRERATAALAARAGIAGESADGLLVAAALSVMMVAARHLRHPTDWASLVGALDAERCELLEAGWGPWIEAAGDGAAGEWRPAVVDAEPGGPAQVAGTARRLVPSVAPEPDPDSAPDPWSVAVVVGDAGEPVEPVEPLGSGGRAVIGAAGRRRRSGSGRRRLALAVAAALLLAGLTVAAPHLLRRFAGTGSGGGHQPGTGQRAVAVTVELADPHGRTSASGLAELSFDAAAGELCFAFAVQDVADPYDAYIHVGAAGADGGIVVDFGEVSDEAGGCVELAPADVAAILADRGGHYVEIHDPDGVTTIRGQLDGAGGDPGPAGALSAVEPKGGGALVVIGAGTVTLTGDVPDQETADELVASYADIDLGATELVDELRIVDGAPRPSGRIVVDAAVVFEFDSDQLIDSDGTVLGDLATIFKAQPSWMVTVVGHTDSSGPAAYNLELSLRRASAVRDTLVEAGVPAEALTIEGAGDTDPVASNDSREGRAENRRIELEVDPR